MSGALRKRSVMHVRTESFHISLCSPYRQIWGDTFGLYCLFLLFKGSRVKTKIQWRRKVSSLISLCVLRRLIWDDTLRTCIKLRLSKVRLNLLYVIPLNFMFEKQHIRSSIIYINLFVKSNELTLSTNNICSV